jgi:hypothetical protein
MQPLQGWDSAAARTGGRAAKRCLPPAIEQGAFGTGIVRRFDDCVTIARS